MSAPETGGAGVAAEALATAKALFEGAQAEEQQLDMLEPVSAEEMAEAREDLGPEAGRLAVLRHAREKRKAGRPPGARNKRTDDFAKYILSFGQDPAVTLIQIASTQEEVMIQASEQPKVHSFSKLGEPRMVVERMTWAEARSIRIRCAEALMPYVHGKKPVSIEHSFAGIGDLVIEGVTHDREEVRDIVDAEFLPVEDQREGRE